MKPKLRGLAKCQPFVSRERQAPKITDAQKQAIHALIERVASGKHTAVRLESLNDAAHFVAVLSHNTTRPISFEFERCEIVTHIEDDETSTLGYLVITTRQTGVGRRSADLQQAEKLQRLLNLAQMSQPHGV